MRPRAGREGFTIVELMVVMILSAMILSGLAALYGTGLRGQLAAMRRNVVQNRAMTAMRALESTMEQATAVTTPATGAGATGMLVGGLNVDPNPAAAPASWTQLTRFTGGEDRRWFAFCVAAAAKCPVAEGYDAPCLWYYTGAGWPPPPIACGDPAAGAPGPYDMLVLAAPLSTATPFQRPNQNMITASFDVTRPGDAQPGVQTRSADITATVNLSMRLRMAN